METQNLWPDFPTEEIKGPKLILKEQATYFTEKTNAVLSAEVITTQYKNTMIHSFYIVAPALGNYRYKLFSIEYDAAHYYPLRINWDDNIPPDEEYDDEGALLNQLKTIFTYPDTIKIISSLLSQSLEEQRA